MSPRSKASSPPSPEPGAVTQEPPAQLPLGTSPGLRVILEGGDLAAVEAAAVEMKLRFGARFAVTGRRLSPDRRTLRISASLLANIDTAMDAEGARQWAHIPGEGDGRTSEG